ncbi:unnamed protein product [marine sediment metagenome]|uniref:Uncharacterized protein n=1 Tax=marine sediment metagenome TaxID=412755 RepID=X0XVW7_9ZZZZ
MDGYAWTWIGIFVLLSILWEWSYRKLRANRDFWHKKAEDYRVMYESGSVEVGKWRRKAEWLAKEAPRNAVDCHNWEWKDWLKAADEAVEEDNHVAENS